MNLHLRRRFITIVVLSTLVVAEHSRSAFGQNVALNKPVIGGTGAWPDESYNSGTFPAQRVTDGSKFEPDDNSSVVTYWLGREDHVTENFTLDLLQSYQIDEIRLFNTHNRQFNDRMTDEFLIYAADSVNASDQLINPVLILAGQLSDVSDQVNVTGDNFGICSGLPADTQARYLRFESLSPRPGLSNVGLNEIEVYESPLVDPNPSCGKVIRGSGASPNLPFNQGTHPASAVIDSNTAENLGNYWLGRDGILSEHFTLDFGEARHIEEVRLFNTHGGLNDRGTKHFRVLAADAVNIANELLNPRVVLEGTLPNIAGLPTSPAVVFTNTNGLIPTDARYLRFEALDAYYELNSVGLNEIEVYDTAIHAPTPRLREGNVAANKPIIDGSGSWDGISFCGGTPFNGGGFPASRVVDESIADNHQDGGRSSYWLGRESCVNEYFTIDLGDVFDIEEIELLNGHNAQFNDRSTDEFVIYGATEVNSFNRLVDPFPLLRSNLELTSDQAIITSETFTDANGLMPGQARYIQFVATTYHPGNRGAALNDIRVYAAVIPEPSAFSLGAIAAFLALWTGRRFKPTPLGYLP